MKSVSPKAQSTSLNTDMFNSPVAKFTHFVALFTAGAAATWGAAVVATWGAAVVATGAATVVATGAATVVATGAGAVVIACILRFVWAKILVLAVTLTVTLAVEGFGSLF